MFSGFYAGLSPALIGITPYMGLNFAIYESVKSFSESPFFKFNLKEKYLLKNKISPSLSSNLIKEKDQEKGKFLGKESESESALAAVFRKGLCGAVAGGTSKFIVYPLVR